MATKLANPAPGVPQASNDALRSAALDDILAVAGLAAAGGVGARGLLGLRYMFGRRKPDLKRSLGPTVVSVPAPVYATPAAAAAGHKLAAAGGGAVTALANNALRAGAALVPPPPRLNPVATGAAAGGLGAATAVGALGLGGYGLYRLATRRAREDKIRREEAAAAAAAAAAPVPAEKRAEPLLTSRSEIPWYLPGITLAGVGGLAGGYKLMDVLMDRKRKADLRAELDEAKAQYRTALLGQFDPASVPGPGAVPDLPPPAKTVNPQPGAARPLALKSAELQADLDALAAAAEKLAAEKAAMPGWAGKGLGIYATLASLLALGSGSLAYNATRARSSSQLVEKAIRDREQERWARRPPEIYAVPQPVRLRAGDLAPAGAMKSLPGV